MDGSVYKSLKDKDDDDVRFITDYQPVALDIHAVYAPGGQEPAYDVKQEPVVYESVLDLPNASESVGWHIGSVNADLVWPDYTGLGVTVAVIDGGFQNYNHPDIDDNIDFVNADPDGENYATPDEDNDHGQATIGLVGAEANGDDYVGIAYNADLVPLTWELSNLYDAADFADVMNNSWGYTTPFNTTGVAHAHHGVVDGRGGLGSVILFAAGNYGDIGEDAGVFGLTATPDTITVGAMDTDGTAAYFTNPGASVLITAPGVQLNTLEGDNGTRTDFAGTSGATPVAAGVAALILEANPDLGYRDVQQIFALSTQYNDSGGASWQYNGAENWNGGGMHFSHLHGYGLVDARAAVRLAETWDEQNTWGNLDSHTQWELPNTAIPDAGAAVTDTMTITAGNALQIETVQVYVNIPDHTWAGDLTVTLTSPDGTVSTLVDQLYFGGYNETGLVYEFLTNAHRGESSEGDWTISVTDNAAQDTGTFTSWSLTFNGQDHSDDDTYFYTDDYSMYASDNSRNELIDTSGIDTLNMAMMTGDITINLAPGSVNDIAGDTFTIDGGTTIENVYTGDGDDDITGNAEDNTIFAGRGNNTVDGGFGNDTFRFLHDLADYTVSIVSGAVQAVIDATTTVVDNVENFLFNGVSYLYSQLVTMFTPQTIDGTPGSDVLTGDIGPDTINGLASDDILDGDAGDDFLYGHDGDDTIFGGNGEDLLHGGFGADELHGGAGDDLAYGYSGNDMLYGDDGADRLFGQGGDDVIYGGNDNDILSGHGGSDSLFGGDGDDSLYGGDDDDILNGGNGSDFLRGDDGHDTLYGYNGDDDLDGGYGNDRIYGQGGVDFIHGDWGDDILKGYADNDIIYGDTGNDRLYGGDGDDLLNGGRNDDILIGEDGDDTLFGYRDNDILNGGDGVDRLYGQSGDDLLFGENGNDILLGHAGNDEIYGGSGADKVYGGDGNDVINGGEHNDTLRGDGGDDTLYGYSGNDVMNGGDGNDAMYGQDGSDTMYGDDGNDTLKGYADDDVIHGGNGADKIYGGDGNDTVHGGNHNDTIRGNDGVDTLYGDAGNDFLDGGWLNDDIWGGAGADIFNFSDNSGLDTVHDFNLAEDDVLRFSDVLSGYDPLSDLITDWVEIIDNAGNSVVRIDQDGNGGAFSMQTVALLENITGLTDESGLEAGGTIVI